MSGLGTAAPCKVQEFPSRASADAFTAAINAGAQQRRWPRLPEANDSAITRGWCENQRTYVNLFQNRFAKMENTIFP